MTTYKRAIDFNLIRQLFYTSTQMKLQVFDSFMGIKNLYFFFAYFC